LFLTENCWKTCAENLLLRAKKPRSQGTKEPEAKAEAEPLLWAATQLCNHKVAAIVFATD